MSFSSNLILSKRTSLTDSSIIETQLMSLWGVKARGHIWILLSFVNLLLMTAIGANFLMRYSTLAFDKAQVQLHLQTVFSDLILVPTYFLEMICQEEKPIYVGHSRRYSCTLFLIPPSVLILSWSKINLDAESDGVNFFPTDFLTAAVSFPLTDTSKDGFFSFK